MSSPFSSGGAKSAPVSARRSGTGAGVGSVTGISPGPSPRTTKNNSDAEEVSLGLVSNVEVFRLFNLHKRECEDVGDYGAAKITQNRLLRMRNQELVRQSDYLKSKHAQEMAILLDAQYEEKAEFLRVWREVHLKNFFGKLKKLEEQLAEKHRIEKEILQARLKGNNSNSGDDIDNVDSTNGGLGGVKFGAEVLNLESRLKRVVQQGAYPQAEALSKRIAVLKEEQRKKHAEKVQARIEAQEELVRKRQKKELDSLSERFRGLKLDTAREQQAAYTHLKKSQGRIVLSLQDKQSNEKKKLYKQQTFLRNHF